MLSLIVFFPFLFGGLLFLSPQKYLNFMALLGSLLQVALAGCLFFLFDPSSFALQLKESLPLIPQWGIHYLLGIDGLSFWYVQLSSFLLPLVVLFSWNQKQSLYFFLIFSLLSLCNGAFLSFDGILFYVFFELSLLPLFFLIFLWGGKQKLYASFKFLIYTFFASLFLLLGLIIMMLFHQMEKGVISASLLDLYQLDFLFIENQFFSPQSLLFFCFFFAFAVKSPLVPFHTWLPLAHVQAPTGASVYLAAVLLKLGTYGWFRFVWPLFPEALGFYSPFILLLAGVSLVYASCMALAQKDMKSLIAYSSIAHMAYVILGLFSSSLYGLKGAFYQTLTHGISSAGLFLIVGLLYQRTKTRQISDYGGLAKNMPYLAILFFIILLSSVALPLTGAFVAEFLVLMGLYFSQSPAIYLALSGVVLGALYMLYLFQSVFLGPVKAFSSGLKDLQLREWAYLIPLCLLIFIMGLFPQLFFKYSKASLEHLNQNKGQYQLNFQGED